MSEQEEQLRLYAKEKVARQKFDEVTNGLGRVCMEFQKLESLFKAAISELMSKEDPMMGSMITAELSFDRLTDLLYAAWKYRWEGSDKVSPLKKILDRCDEARGARNQLVHSEWYLDQEDAEGAMRVKMAYRSRRGFRIQNEKITPAKMQEIADELQSCRHELAQFLYDNRST
jgi:hypothetical protein